MSGNSRTADSVGESVHASRTGAVCRPVPYFLSGIVRNIVRLYAAASRFRSPICKIRQSPRLCDITSSH